MGTKISRLFRRVLSGLLPRKYRWLFVDLPAEAAPEVRAIGADLAAGLRWTPDFQGFERGIRERRAREARENLVWPRPPAASRGPDWSKGRN